jgi:hypothetical protein
MAVYTRDMFETDFPQLRMTPGVMVDQFIAMAAAVVDAEVWAEQWRYGSGLYVAHRCTLHLRRADGAAVTAVQGAATGDVHGLIASEKAEGESVTYDHALTLQGPAGAFGLFQSTSYGQEFASMAALYAMGGVYVG